MIATYISRPQAYHFCYVPGKEKPVRRRASRKAEVCGGENHKPKVKGGDEEWIAVKQRSITSAKEIIPHKKQAPYQYNACKTEVFKTSFLGHFKERCEKSCLLKAIY